MKNLITILLLLFPAILSAQNHQQHYKIYDVRNKKLSSILDIVKDADQADVLFFGEEHNDSIGHNLEVLLFRQLNEAYPGKITLSLEMFQTDVQQVMDEYLLGLITEKNLLGEGRGWKNYKDYRAMVDYAKSNVLDVIAANTPTRYTNAVTKSGLQILKQFPKSSRVYLPKLPIDTATGRYYEKFSNLMGKHMGSTKIYQSQNLWDATMAWSMASYFKKHKHKKIFHINGRFHSDEKLGALAQLKKYSPRLKIINISCFYDDSFINPEWDKFESLGDYIILTDPEIKKTF